MKENSLGTLVCKPPRSEFIEALGRFEVSAFQYSVDEIAEEVNSE